MAAPGGPPPSLPPAGSRPAARSQRGLRRRFNVTPFVLTLVLGAVVFGAIYAYNEILAPIDTSAVRVRPTATEIPDPSPTPTPTPSPTDTATEEPDDEREPPVIASGDQLDPDSTQDVGEHPEAVDRAIDGDMDTYWYTRTYNQADMPGKRGVGYFVQLEREALVSSVTLYVGGTGGNVEVRATEPSQPDGGTLLAAGPMESETVLHFDEPVATEYVVFWFTELPQTPDGSNRVELREVEVT